MKPRLFHLIAQARQNLFRSADRVFSTELEVSGTQVLALFAIKQAPSCLLEDLGQVLQLKNSAITGLVSRMEENGLIIKQPCDIDGRASEFTVSKQGAAVVAKAVPLLKVINTQLTDGFSDEEIATIARFLQHAISINFTFNKDIVKCVNTWICSSNWALRCFPRQLGESRRIFRRSTRNSSRWPMALRKCASRIRKKCTTPSARSTPSRCAMVRNWSPACAPTSPFRPVPNGCRSR